MPLVRDAVLCGSSCNGQNGWMARPSGFEYTSRKNGEVVITHFGRQVAVLRGTRADRFLELVKVRDDQELMARMTGNYKRGNEA